MKRLHGGIDVGSTTVKIVLMDGTGRILYKDYRRHLSNVRETVASMLRDTREANRHLLEEGTLTLMMTGSGGLSISEKLGIAFVQEVIACATAVEERIPGTDVAIELGGEDAKITYFGENMEQRMNGTCAGGTGAFIDQMAILLKTDVTGLNEYARQARQIYPIASRCGVFAKTDIQPLLNEGAAREDIARSVYQAVVNQTISGLACGRPIRGRVAYLGGPLYFLDGLRERFTETLGLSPDDVVFPEDSHYFVAIGTALASRGQAETTFGEVIERIDRLLLGEPEQRVSLPPLFGDQDAYEQFRRRHARARVERVPPGEAAGDCFLGIDAGSTTSKIALIDARGRLLYERYGNNEGAPLLYTVALLREMYAAVPDTVRIAHAAVTGYGEGLIQAALQVDVGEIETVAHQKAASFFLPGVDFILDIGGQDMKCMMIHDGIIDSIKLNEACSSGCGSFIETFARSLDMEVEEFGQAGIQSRSPVDLGTRCTVFMNSKIKQVQKEGASLADISAGIAYSVIKNALYKVIKLRSPEQFGENVVVQGGTFYNDSVLRAFEIVTGREPVRPDIAGIMGAFGAALIARERYPGTGGSSLPGPAELEDFEYDSSLRRCGLCGNNCLLTVNRFRGGVEYVTGNRCERGSGRPGQNGDLPNMFRYKYRRVFQYPTLSPDEAHRGTVGIPRVLNIYEQYPFWHTLFTRLGFRVVLSRRSSKEVYELGMESVPSESLCYPAKLAHGHIMDLVRKEVDCIFYPSIPYDLQEDPEADNRYSCPIVTSYPEVIQNNMDAPAEAGIRFLHPFLPMFDKARMKKRMKEVLAEEYGIGKGETARAVEAAYAALEEYKNDVQAEGERALAWLEENRTAGVILAGRPYHLDPEVNHGIPEMLNGLGLGVLTEDGVSHLARVDRPLRVVDQWMYHTRLYNAAQFCLQKPDLELIQLNSFGCGLDAVTTDQVQEILEDHGKLYTVIKIDEINNLGAARIRARSLVAAMRERRKHKEPQTPTRTRPPARRPLFTPPMAETHTLLVPEMSPIHFEFLETVLRSGGYRAERLPEVSPETIELGLKYVNNDACYPSLIVTGQILEGLLSGRYDLDRVSVIISQTGGGCRATNYIAFIRKALRDAGMEKVPVIPLNASRNLEKMPGFRITIPMVHRLVMAVVWGDLLMRLLYRCRPYEAEPGSADALHRSWVPRIQESVRTGSIPLFSEEAKNLIRDFEALPLQEALRKPRVGVVGEILVKFHPYANNQIVEYLEKEGAEAVVPDLLDFFLYSLHGKVYDHQEMGGSYRERLVAEMAVGLMELYRSTIRRCLEGSRRFVPPTTLRTLTEGARGILSLGNRTGEGWFLTAEMVELLHMGVNNIVCIQPFACLPNHVTGKGMIKGLRRRFPQANIAPVDYDPGSSQVNQMNRIRLMLSVAKKKLAQEPNEAV